MKFGVNALFLIPGEVGGTETYVRCTLPGLAARLAPYEELVVFANAAPSPVSAACSSRTSRFPASPARSVSALSGIPATPRSTAAPARR